MGYLKPVNKHSKYFLFPVILILAGVATSCAGISTVTPTPTSTPTKTPLSSIPSSAQSASPVMLLPYGDTVNLEAGDQAGIERAKKEKEEPSALPMNRYGVYLSRIFYVENKDTVSLTCEADYPLFWEDFPDLANVGIGVCLYKSPRENPFPREFNGLWIKEIKGDGTSRLTVTISPDREPDYRPGYFLLRLQNKDNHSHLCRYNIGFCIGQLNPEGAG